MSDRAEKTRFKQFCRPSEWFHDVDHVAAAELAAVGSDIALILSEKGEVQDVSYANASLQPYAPDKWIGRPWEAIVTTESVDKVRALLSDITAARSTRRRQINHPQEGLPDLPVNYALVAIDGSSSTVALGQDLRKIADMQSRMVQNQLEMEREYRDLRQAETRYRMLFQLIAQPMFIVDGDLLRILDVNRAAAELVERPSSRLVGETVTTLFRRGAREDIDAVLEAAQRQGTADSLEVRLANQDGSYAMTVQPFRDDGKVNLLVRLRQITREGEDADSDAFDPQGLIWELPEAVVVTDGEGIVEQPNDQFLNMVKAVTREHVIGRNLNSWVGSAAIDMQLLMSNLKEKGEVRSFSTVIRDDFGKSIPVRIAAKRLTGPRSSRIGFLIAEATGDSGYPSVTGALPYEPSNFGELVGRVPLKELLREASDIIEKLCIEAALRQTGNNRASAAEMLGLSRQSLYIKLKRHGVGSPEAE